MKWYSALFFIVVCFFITKNGYADLNGTFTGFEEISIHHTQYFKINTYSTQVAYTQGGITINYPLLLDVIPFFTEIPFVTVSIEHLNLVYTPGVIVSTTITANSATSVTIRVNKIVGASTPVEADSNDFLVTIFAIGKGE